ncbi:uncharacterized protein EI97DRAFT_46801 [Westerdykella ornata]|uniref:Uncharacterized protein n=1 Tax=Westerdykella ornata TaxID=318751 RepID=A0A6A6JM97_WESOR|nr:uncharacterized protein EI97DRAFT_46801 [Westerdykella ornata]KAF2276049.1 hypothetical protein EI97DRAFT_46801 [Westerdykella ornata]
MLTVSFLAMSQCIVSYAQRLNPLNLRPYSISLFLSLSFSSLIWRASYPACLPVFGKTKFTQPYEHDTRSTE